MTLKIAKPKVSCFQKTNNAVQTKNLIPQTSKVTKLTLSTRILQKLHNIL